MMGNSGTQRYQLNTFLINTDMKKLTAIMVCIVAATICFAQEDEYEESSRNEIKTIFSKETKATGFGAFDMTFTGMNDGYALLLGGHGGLIFNKKVMVGFGGYGITTPVKFEGIDPSEPLELTGGYGGFVLGYVLAPREVFHASFPMIIGVGGMDVREADFRYDINDPLINDRIENSIFVVIEPGAQMEINITRFFRLGVGLSYRFTEGVNLERNNITDEDTSGLAGNISFKFGGF